MAQSISLLLLLLCPVVSFKSEAVHSVVIATRATPQQEDASSAFVFTESENASQQCPPAFLDPELPRDSSVTDMRLSPAPLQTLPPWSEASYRFSSYANWLDKGLLVGRYPGVEPSRCSNASRAEDHLTELIAKANVVTWVCFQAEVPSQVSALPSLSTALVEPVVHSGASDAAVYSSKQVAVMTGAEAADAAAAGEEAPVEPPAPWTLPSAEEWKPGEPNAFYEGGRSGDFGAYAPTAARIAAALGKPAPRFLHFPIMDLTAPSLPALRGMARAVWRELARQRQDPNGGAVYLHCWGGKGRSGTVGAAVLAMLYAGASEAEVLARLRAAFSTRGLPGETPETDSQLLTLSRFVRELRNEEAGAGKHVAGNGDVRAATDARPQ
jgi:alanine transaminase